MTQMLVDSHFADSHLISNLLISQPGDKPQSYHTSALLCQHTVNNMVEPGDIILIRPIPVVNLFLIESIKPVEPVSEGKIADMGETREAHTIQEVGGSDALGNVRKQRREDIVHYVARHITVMHQTVGKSDHGRVVAAEKLFYVVSVRHTFILKHQFRFS